MPPKISPETLRAVKLVKNGYKPAEAARMCGLNKSTLSRCKLLKGPFK